jgi:hypothetical protein
LLAYTLTVSEVAAAGTVVRGNVNWETCAKIQCGDICSRACERDAVGVGQDIPEVKINPAMNTVDRIFLLSIPSPSAL